MSPSLPNFVKLVLIFCLTILAVNSAFAQAPVHINFSLDGCRFYAGITLPDGGGQIICHPDDPGKPDDAYTNGNQGKGWAELGLVPFRLTTTAGSQSNVTTTYQVTIAADYQDKATPPDLGFDIISTVQVDPNDQPGSQAVSDPSCTVGSSGTQLTTGTQHFNDASSTIYRVLTLSQNPGTTCYFAWYQRLALGSHNFSGSSLHSYIFQGPNFEGGMETVPLPVVQCKPGQTNCAPSPAPQSIIKDMTATAAGAGNTWGLTGSGPGTVTANTCDPNQLTQSGLKFTVTWTAVATAAGTGVNIVTHVYATNPSPSLVYAQVADVLTGPNGYSNTFTTTGTGTSAIPIPANSTNLLILTDTESDSSGVAGDMYSDTATATYWDFFGNPGGSATASFGPVAATAGPATNTSATIQNSENITGSDVNFSTDLATPSDVSVTGTFEGLYTLGTKVPKDFTGPVIWDSNSQLATTVEGLGGSAGVTFSKSIYLPSATATTETLTDNAALTTSDGTVANMLPGPLSVIADAAPTVSLTITKNISQAVTADQTFTFHICKTTDYTSAGNACNSSNEVVTPPTITVSAGTVTNNSSPISLQPDNYTVTEDSLQGWTTDSPQPVNDAPNPTTGAVNCSPSVTFTNTLVGQDLQVTKTATASFTRTYKWTILKGVTPTRIEQVGGNATFNYTVSVSHDAGTDSAWKVKGTITVTNPNSVDFTGVNVTDSIDNSGACSLDNAFNGTVAANSHVDLPYTCTYSSAPSPTSGTNTATATWSGSFPTPDTSAQGTHSYAFGNPTTVVDDSVTVTDAFNGGAAITLGTVNLTTTTPNTTSATDGGLTITSSGYGIFNYSRTVSVPASGCKEYDNTSKFTTNTTSTTGSASAAATVCGSGKTGALTMGFWQNKNGQGIISGQAKTGVCPSATWLRGFNPFQDLSATSTCAQVATYVYNVIKAANASGSSMNAMLKAQMLSTALDVYFSNPALGGNKIGAFNGLGSTQGPIGAITIDLTKVCNMIDNTSTLTATCTGTPQYINTSSAFGAPPASTCEAVSYLLAYASSQAVPATSANTLSNPWYGQNKTTQGLAKNTFDAINNQAAFTCGP